MIDESPLTYHEKLLKRLDEREELTAQAAATIRDLMAENKRLQSELSLRNDTCVALKMMNATNTARIAMLEAALSALWRETELAGNADAKDYGWPKVREMVQAALSGARTAGTEGNQAGLPPESKTDARLLAPTPRGSLPNSLGCTHTRVAYDHVGPYCEDCGDVPPASGTANAKGEGLGEGGGK